MRQPLTRKRLVGHILAASLALVLLMAAGLAWGSSSSGLTDMFGRMDVVWFARMPRVVFAASVGAALAVAGAVFQAVLRNPLADPFILGVSGGAALGGSLMVALVGTGLALSVPAASFAGALASLALIVAVGKWLPGGRFSTFVLLLTGVVFNAFASAVIMFLKAVLSAQKAQELLHYLMGTLAVEGTSLPETTAVTAAIVVSILAMLGFGRELNLLSLGDEEAQTLGVDVRRVRHTTVLLASLGVSISVAYTGLIGFVGLVVPHGVRLVVGPDHRLLLPLCALSGAAFLVGCDLIARLSFAILDTALPVGVVTAFVGGPLFVYFLRRNLLGHESR